MSTTRQTRAQLRSALAAFGLGSARLQTIEAGPRKGIWRVDAGRDRFCLKRLPHEPERSLWSAGAQAHLRDRGCRVPYLVATGDRRLFAEIDGRCFTLQEWIEGRHPVEHRRSWPVMLRALAEFHACSRGYRPAPEARTSSKLQRWPVQYEKEITDLENWRTTAGRRPERQLRRAHRVYLETVPGMLALARKALQRLLASPYRDWTGAFAREPGLCHQDFGPSNVLLTTAGPYVIDFDGVTFDLPLRDLRKWFDGNLRPGDWRSSTPERLLAVYTEAYAATSAAAGSQPFTPAQLDVLWIDLLFPHAYREAAKKIFQKGEADDGVARDLAATNRLLRQRAAALSARIETPLEREPGAATRGEGS